MKFLFILICLVVCVLQSQAQSSCRGSVPFARQDCVDGLNEGNKQGRHCHRNANTHMYYFDSVSRRCFQMTYRGCGGNNNRFCTLADCRWQCRRSRSIE